MAGQGQKQYTSSRPLLVVANHMNLADPPILAVCLGRRRPYFMAKEDLFSSRFSKYFIRGFGAFPVKRGRIDRQAFRQAEGLLNEGNIVVMFPEGRRSQNGQLQNAFPGSAMVAMRCDVPILPIAIAGTEKLKGPFWWLRRRR